MRRPSTETQHDEYSTREDYLESKVVESSTCKAGQSCIGCFSGVMLAYMALVLFNNNIAVIVMMVNLFIIYP